MLDHSYNYKEIKIHQDLKKNNENTHTNNEGGRLRVEPRRVAGRYRRPAAGFSHPHHLPVSPVPPSRVPRRGARVALRPVRAPPLPLPSCRPGIDRAPLLVDAPHERPRNFVVEERYLRQIVVNLGEHLAAAAQRGCAQRRGRGSRQGARRGRGLRRREGVVRALHLPQEDAVTGQDILELVNLLREAYADARIALEVRERLQVLEQPLVADAECAPGGLPLLAPAPTPPPKLVEISMKIKKARAQAPGFKGRLAGISFSFS